MRVADGEPGVECQIDFAQMGLLRDPETGRRRKVHALIFTAVLFRHMFVWLTYSQTLAAVIAGCEAAWAFFGGVFKVLIPDNLKPVVTEADAVNPRLSPRAGWTTPSTRVRHRPGPGPLAAGQAAGGAGGAVRARQLLGRGDFADLADAQARAEAWCRDGAGMRIHGTTAARPAEVFAELEAAALLPVPARLRRAGVHPGEGAPRLPRRGRPGRCTRCPRTTSGSHLDARADSALVKLYCRGQLVKTHPGSRPVARSTDPDDLPEEKAGYAMRDLTG